jgi:hypothetical protein
VVDLNRPPAILAMVGALLVPATLVFASSPAQAEVPNDTYVLTDKSSDAFRADLEIDNARFSVVVRAECALDSDTSNSPDEGSLLVASSTHPDRSQLKKERGSLEQAQKDNPPVVTLATGSGDGKVTNHLLCEKAEAEGEVKTKKSPNQGSFEASGKKCVCDTSEELEGSDCTVFTAQVNRLVTDCQNDKGLEVSFEGETLKRFKIKGKGDAFLASEVPRPDPD